MREKMQPMDWVLAVPAWLYIASVMLLLRLNVISADRAYVYLHPEDWRTPPERPEAAPERRANTTQEQSTAR
jgi:hypothetical protein